MVRAVPLHLSGHPLILLLLRDIRDEKRREAIEQVFFHDVNNLLTGLSGISAAFEYADVQTYPELASRVERLSKLLADEVQSHTLLLDAEKGRYTPRPKALDLEELFQTLRELFDYQPCAGDRELSISIPEPTPDLRTDEALLHRILVNMVKNAFEATPPGGTVRLWVEEEGSTLIFRVHNAGWMKERVAMRVFQRHFSTKEEPGRGLGTYSMKLLGERCLDGKVSFATSEAEGTTFSLEIRKDGG
jgi:signal transduction histidine kinase